MQGVHPLFRAFTSSKISLRGFTRGALVALCLASAPSWAAGLDLQYDVLTEGKHIGSSTETRRMLAGSEGPVQEIIPLNSLDILIREDGIDEDGPYSVVLSKFPLENEPLHLWDGANHAQ